MVDVSVLAPRRQPVQARSIERVSRILAEAASLISEVGLEATSMSAIARRTEMSLASLYRYFPNKTALLQAIAERHVRRLEQTLRDLLPALDLNNGVNELIDVYARFYRTEPGYKEIWSSVGAIPELQALDLQELHANARDIQVRIRGLFPELDARRAWLASLLLPRACGTILRLGMTLSEEDAQGLNDELKAMVRAYLRDLYARALATGSLAEDVSP